jgi:hypothetical protein
MKIDGTHAAAATPLVKNFFQVLVPKGVESALRAESHEAVADSELQVQSRNWHKTGLRLSADFSKSRVPGFAFGYSALIPS